MTFAKLLAAHKLQARKEDALVPLLDQALLMFAAVWPRVPLEPLGDPAGDDWDALWACVQVDMAALAELADVTEPAAARAFNRLKALRLIYPDGTAAQTVNQWLSGFPC